MRQVSFSMTSDFVCPWCYIGEHNLRVAIARLPADIDVKVELLPFELNPDMPVRGKNRNEYRLAKFGSRAKCDLLDARVIAAGSAVGVAFNYTLVNKTPNTMLMHRLVWAAGQNGGDTGNMAHRFFTGYFRNGLDLTSREILHQIATQSGLPEAQAHDVLSGELGANEVKELTRMAYRKGVAGVPLFEIGSEILSGAQPAEAIEQAVLRAAAA